jgi:hypothetical protein
MWAYISMMVSSSSSLTFSTLSLKLCRLPSSIFTHLSCSSSSLICASFSRFWWYRFLTLSFVVVMKEVPTYAMDDWVFIDIFHHWGLCKY